MTAIVRGAAYDLLCVMPDQSIKYRDVEGYVHVAREGDYRLIKKEQA